MLTANRELDALNYMLTNRNGGNVMFCCTFFCISVAREKEAQTFLSNDGENNHKHTLV